MDNIVVPFTSAVFPNEAANNLKFVLILLAKAVNLFLTFSFDFISPRNIEFISFKLFFVISAPIFAFYILL